MMKFINSIFEKITSTQVRIFGWSFFAAFFITVALPLLFFFYLFNPDDVRKMIVSQVNNEQYEVKINGEIAPKTWHGLALYVADTTVYDKHGHEVLHINDANYQLSWPYLIIGKYKVKRISLKGVTLTKNAKYNGLINYDYFHASEFDNLNYLSVASLKFNDESGNELINDASLRISNIANNPELNLQFKLPQLNTSIEMLGDFIKQDNSLIFDKLDTKLVNDKFTVDAQSAANYSLSSQALIIDDLNGLINAPEYSGSINIESGVLAVDELSLSKVTGAVRYKNVTNSNQVINLSAANITSADYNHFIAGLVNFNLNTTYSNHDIALSVAAIDLHFDYLFNVKNQNLSVAYNATCAESNNFPDSLAMNGSFSNDSESSVFVGKFIGNYQHSPIKVALKYNYADTTPKIFVDGEIESLDFRSYHEADKDELLPLYQDKDPIALDWLGKLNLTSNLSVDQLMLSKVSLNNVTANVQVNESQIVVNNLNALVYKGKLSTNLTLSKVNDGYNFAINGKMNNVDLQKAFNNIFNVNAINGVADVSMATVTNNVKSFSDIYDGLTGNILLNIQNGGFSGVDFNLFLSPENLAAFMDQKSAQTQFTNLSAKFKFRNGISESGLLNFSSPTIKANGSGVVDFKHDKIKYDLLIQSSLPDNQHKVNSVIIPTTVMGDLFKPKIYIKNMKLNKSAIK